MMKNQKRLVKKMMINQRMIQNQCLIKKVNIDLIERNINIGDEEEVTVHRLLQITTARIDT